MFSFRRHPAAIGIGDGLQTAFDYLQAAWRRWLPAVVAIAVVTGFLYLLLGSVSTASLYYIDASTGQLVWQPDAGNQLSRLAGIELASGLVGLVGGWVFTAAAIAGLRNRPMTTAFVVVRGLLSVVASILLALLVGVAAIAWFVLLLGVPGIALLLLLALIPALIYVAVRVAFFTIAIFDGYGPIEGIREAWRLSRGGVVRLFGWALMAILIEIGFGIVAGIVGGLLGGGSLLPLGQAVTTLVTTTGSCFVVFMMAVLYESQRARHDPGAYGYAGGPGYPPPYPGGPYPYAGGPYPSGPYPYAPGAPAWPGEPVWPAPGGSPGDQGAYPGGPAPYPGAPAPWPGAPAPYPGVPVPYPGAPAQYPGGPAPYPAGPAPYPGVPAPWPGAPAPYPGVPVPYPGAPAPYPGVPVPYPGAAGMPPAWPPQQNAGSRPPQGAAPAYTGGQAPGAAAPEAAPGPVSGSTPEAPRSGDEAGAGQPDDPTVTG